MASAGKRQSLLKNSALVAQDRSAYFTTILSWTRSAFDLLAALAGPCQWQRPCPRPGLLPFWLGPRGPGPTPAFAIAVQRFLTLCTRRPRISCPGAMAAVVQRRQLGLGRGGGGSIRPRTPKPAALAWESWRPWAPAVSPPTGLPVSWTSLGERPTASLRACAAFHRVLLVAGEPSGRDLGAGPLPTPSPARRQRPASSGPRGLRALWRNCVPDAQQGRAGRDPRLCLEASAASVPPLSLGTFPLP